MLMIRKPSIIALVYTLAIFFVSGGANASCSKTIHIGYADWTRAGASGENDMSDYRMDAEILEGILKLAGCQFTRKPVPSKRLQEAIRYGDIDGTMGASLNIARQQYAWFTKAYRREVMAMFMLSAKIPTFRPAMLTDLQVSKLRFGVGIGAWHGEKFETMVSSDPAFRKRVLFSDDFRILFQLLQRDRVDIVLMDLYAGTHLLKLTGKSLKNTLSQNKVGHAAELPEANIFAFASRRKAFGFER